MTAQNKTLSLAVLSGKGGVGKSNLALNLAYALAGKKASVLLIDCDLGLANLDVLLGLAPQNNIQTLLNPKVKVEDLTLPLIPGLSLLPANSGILDGLDKDKALIGLLADKLDSPARSRDFVILDVGAGIADTALAFAAMPLLRLMVITPEPTSLTDGYALIKVLAARHGIRDHFVLVNQALSAKEEEQAFQRLRAACERFLHINPAFLGAVRHDPKVAEAVRAQKPALQLFPAGKFAAGIMETADKLIRLRASSLERLADKAPLLRPRLL